MSLQLGSTEDGIAQLTNEERSRHVHIVGASGTGKSKLLESLIRKDIASRRGLCLIDPHGTLADSVIAWCAATGMDRHRTVEVIEPSAADWCLGFNPLRDDGLTERSARVDAMIAACAQVWGGEDTNATPQLKKCLRALFTVLSVHGLTLAEAPYFTHSSDVELRRLLTDRLPEGVFKTVWEDLERLPRREFFEHFASTNNRLMEFLASPVIRRIVGQGTRTLDLRAAMDEGHVIIVNLAYKGVLSPDNARLLGTLITSELLLVALSRDPLTAKRRPFTLYLDECARFLTSDIEDMLDETRKFGLHLVLAHQRLGQLGPPDSRLYKGVMGGAQSKIVFGGLMDDDAVAMARELYRSSFDLERPKRSLDRPTVVGEEVVWMESQSWSKSVAETEGRAEARTWGASVGSAAGVADAIDIDTGNVLRTVQSSSSALGSAQGGALAQNRSETYGETQGRGLSQAFRPLWEVLPTQVHSLEEELHLAAVRLRELPNQRAVLKTRGKSPVLFQPETIHAALASRDRQLAFVEGARSVSRCMSPIVQAEAEISVRQAGLRDRFTEPAPSPVDHWTYDEET